MHPAPRSEPVEKGKLKINYRPRSVELVFKGSRLDDKKSIVRVDHPFVERVYTANKDGDMFTRVIFKEGLVARDYENRVGFEVKENRVFLKIADKEVFPSTPAEDLDAILDKEVAKILSEDMDMPEKKPVTEKVMPVAEVVAKADTKDLKESEIPVLTKTEEKKVEADSPYSRLIMSFIVIALFGAAMAMITRWWKKKSTKSLDNNKIRVVTQHFLGPRKSLAIVRVAGENILIGVTDQNINMIKSLSLLDEDQTTFGQVLQGASQLNAQFAYAFEQASKLYRSFYCKCESL